MIVFIHGLFPGIYDAPKGWLCPELPGYGSTVGEPTLQGAVEFLNGLIHEPAVVVEHSIGGAIAILFAAKYPERVSSVINVEGNFTLKDFFGKDAFWSKRLAEMTDAEAVIELGNLKADPAAWLLSADVPVTTASMAVAERALGTPASTVQSMARSVVEITEKAAYLMTVRKALDRHPMHLIAGERSRAGWDVPPFVVERAASFQIQPDAGHMLMVNDLRAFTALVERAIR